ncbi:uncharacterized protein LOC110854405 isoform X2 [Folsomia candida]|uniref:uncharacterized protein LOC110854405 isoform X2 n=1 Tax=Folsomia candida TaxID=158441 RepID=UPI001604FCD4|nr:uncharacterized protein LOC110854405 isoform X2 [Folsomia candida]
MKRLERCKGETSYHKIESDTDGESSPNSSGVVVTTSTPKKRSDSEQSRKKTCTILEIQIEGATAWTFVTRVLPDHRIWTLAPPC